MAYHGPLEMMDNTRQERSKRLQPQKYLALRAEETACHLFLHCKFVTKLWSIILEWTNLCFKTWNWLAYFTFIILDGIAEGNGRELRSPLRRWLRKAHVLLSVTIPLSKELLEASLSKEPTLEQVGNVEAKWVQVRVDG
ncbi:hypothetical protein PIB30_057158 [Stylosanthes scabra]|uniref:Reverse transcriptase zinc-binding domain-containing protein n=1 Tax=Stylosanthes scabra TaxID=79078 RepID=A0ABU6XJG6_9FABA|nr:hypothetical protein [Stylosanthes scabra]